MMLLDHDRGGAQSFIRQSSGDSTKSLQKLTDSCEMKDLTGRSIYETKARVVRKQYSLHSNSDAI